MSAENFNKKLEEELVKEREQNKTLIDFIERLKNEKNVFQLRESIKDFDPLPLTTNNDFIIQTLSLLCETVNKLEEKVIEMEDKNALLERKLIENETKVTKHMLNF